MAGKLKDITGERFTRLTVIKLSHIKNRKSYWLCECDCGNEHIVRSDSLKCGNVKSCGCLNMEAKSIKHGEWGTKLYFVWAGMKQRCTNPKQKHYDRYGGRGISVCEEWQTYEPFHKWAINAGYKEGLTIDRINNDGNYEPSNCRWVTIAEQQKNKTQRKAKSKV